MGKEETEITKQTRKRLAAMDVWNFKHWTGPFSPEGVSDLIGIRTVKVKDLVAAGVDEVGVFLAIELKAPGARTDKDRLAKQQAFLRNVEVRGGIGIMSSSPAEVEELLTNYYKIRKEA